jgi:hypothetical protein
VTGRPVGADDVGQGDEFGFVESAVDRRQRGRPDLDDDTAGMGDVVTQGSCG